MMIVIVFAVIIIVLAILLNFQQQNFQEHIQNITEHWQIERSVLLDRIQAPTFAEYKQAEIKMVKAQKDEEPKPSFVLE